MTQDTFFSFLVRRGHFPGWAQLDSDGSFIVNDRLNVADRKRRAGYKNPIGHRVLFLTKTTCPVHFGKGIACVITLNHTGHQHEVHQNRHAAPQSINKRLASSCARGWKVQKEE